MVDLDEVIVVSQPKDLHLLRQQPLSSSLFGAEELQQLNVRDVRELSAFVPSFAMPIYGSRYTSSMYIRGIGSRVNSPAVGLYVDNIPVVSKSMLNFHAYEVDRIDVLRGPQGTLSTGRIPRAASSACTPASRSPIRAPMSTYPSARVSTARPRWPIITR